MHHMMCYSVTLSPESRLSLVKNMEWWVRCRDSADLTALGDKPPNRKQQSETCSSDTQSLRYAVAWEFHMLSLASSLQPSHDAPCCAPQCPLLSPPLTLEVLLYLGQDIRSDILERTDFEHAGPARTVLALVPFSFSAADIDSSISSSH